MYEPITVAEGFGLYCSVSSGSLAHPGSYRDEQEMDSALPNPLVWQWETWLPQRKKMKGLPAEGDGRCTGKNYTVLSTVMSQIQPKLGSRSPGIKSRLFLVAPCEFSLPFPGSSPSIYLPPTQARQATGFQLYLLIHSQFCPSLTDCQRHKDKNLGCLVHHCLHNAQPHA